MELPNGFNSKPENFIIKTNSGDYREIKFRNSVSDKFLKQNRDK